MPLLVNEGGAEQWMLVAVRTIGCHDRTGLHDDAGHHGGHDHRPGRPTGPSPAGDDAHGDANRPIGATAATADALPTTSAAPANGLQPELPAGVPGTASHAAHDATASRLLREPGRSQILIFRH